MEQQEKVFNPKERTEKREKWQGKQLARWYILNPNGSEIEVSVNRVRSSNKRHFQIVIQCSYLQERQNLRIQKGKKWKDVERYINSKWKILNVAILTSVSGKKKLVVKRDSW